MMAWALFCHDFDLSKGINILSEKCPVVLDHYTQYRRMPPVQTVSMLQVVCSVCNIEISKVRIMCGLSVVYAT
jgi:hypothetical protein